MSDYGFKKVRQMMGQNTAKREGRYKTSARRVVKHIRQESARLARLTAAEWDDFTPPKKPVERGYRNGYEFAREYRISDKWLYERYKRRPTSGEALLEFCDSYLRCPNRRQWWLKTMADREALNRINRVSAKDTRPRRPARATAAAKGRARFKWIAAKPKGVPPIEYSRERSETRRWYTVGEAERQTRAKLTAYGYGWGCQGIYRGHYAGVV